MASQVHPSGSHVRRHSTPRSSLRRQRAWRELPRRLVVNAKRTRFSLTKLKQLLAYSQATSVWRKLTVIVLFPIPSVLASFVAPLIPLNDPTRGFGENPTFLLLLFTTCMLTVSGTMPQVRAAAAIPHELYTNIDILLVGVVSSVPILGLASFVATNWRFPIPFFWVLAAGPWLLCVIFGNAVVLRRQWHRVGRPLVAYMPALAVQVAQIIIYPAYSALFEAAHETSQIVLIMLFPFLKAALKKGIFLLTRRSNRDLSAEISTTPSLLATGLLIGIDVLQGLVAIRQFWKHSSALVPVDVLATLARAADDRGPLVQNDKDLSKFATRQVTVWPSAATARLAPPQISASTPSDSSRDKLCLTQALELLQSAETILLVEYLEVAVPLVNAIYLAFATQFATSVYNPRLRPFYHHPEALASAISSVVLYTSLQALTLVAMAMAMQCRLKPSALTLLAFVLENHAWSLQGKLVPWLSVFLVFPIVHFGVDFSFTFDFASPPLG